MPITIDHVPYEILSAILHETVKLNLRDASIYSYGLLYNTSSPASGIHLKAHKCPDTVRWITTEAIRQVNRTWHDWACRYALHSVYLNRWRGSERWLQSRSLTEPGMAPSGVAVYRDPYCSLKKTARLFQDHDLLASSVRRIWFDGYYGADTSVLILKILRSCEALQYVTLPWTVLRHGSAQDWSYICGRNRCGSRIESLELLAVDLKESQTSYSANWVDREPLHQAGGAVDFSDLKRLKIYGNSCFMPITDLDLQGMARTATKLRELHITRTTAVTLSGLLCLIEASRASLQLVDYSPLSEYGQEVLGPLCLSRESIKTLFAGTLMEMPDRSPLTTLTSKCMKVCEDVVP